MLCQDSQQPSTGSSLHAYLYLKVVICWCIYCIFIQGIHAVENGGWEVKKDPGTGEVRYEVTACGLWDLPTELTWSQRQSPHGNPGRGKDPADGSAWGWPWSGMGGR